MIWCDRSTK